MQESKRFEELNVGDKFILLPSSPNVMAHEVFMKIKNAQEATHPQDENYGLVVNAISLPNGRLDFVNLEDRVLKLAI